ncbi:hypothetical protein ACFLZP_01280 [Patescibacteria group bacterium]
MSTNDNQNQPNTPAPQTPNQAENDNGEALTNLADALGSVDPNAPDAQVNATSISDNNGGRIDLNQDKFDNRANPQNIKK